MKNWLLLLCTTLTTMGSSHAFASEAESKALPAQAPESTAVPAMPKKAFNTGVAKGRDLLDTAISASTLDEVDLPKLGTVSVAGIIGNLPGIRSESPGVDGISAVTIRGLPLTDDGSKFVQFQEDGLPVLEFGDVHFYLPDMFLRADIGLSQVQSIRGGSASTFASNSPGGVINFISKTGETAGGSIQFAGGLDHDLNRVDFSYGSPLGDGWRFHVGGFYRQGEGPRAAGYDAFKGGQVKLNVTRQFANGYVRLYGKYLDDRQPDYGTFPVLITGTDASPVFGSVPGTDIRSDAFVSLSTSSIPGVNADNNVEAMDLSQGVRGKARSIGSEAQFDFGAWNVSNKFRFSSLSAGYAARTVFTVAPAGILAQAFGGPGAFLSLAGGPGAGQRVTDPSTLGGTGLVALTALTNKQANTVGNFTNDLRTSRAWTLGRSKLTLSAGLYASSQAIKEYVSIAVVLQSVAPGGQTVPVDLTIAGGPQITDGGTLAYGLPQGFGFPTAAFHRGLDVRYRILAPYASANLQIGKVALGGSVRFDEGKVSGSLLGADLGGRGTSTAVLDLNGNGAISFPEAAVAVLPLGQPGKVDYKYNYLSYSVGLNYRIANTLSVFGRYSRGSRAGADRLLFTPAIDYGTGKLTDPALGYSPVKQAEAGFKLRHEGVTLFVTGFWAATRDRTSQVGASSSGTPILLDINREFSAKGIELESEFRHGPFSLALTGTYAKAKIVSDSTNAAIVGNRPRHQPSLFFAARPQLESGIVTVGATINGTTSSFAQDVNLLKQPGYTVVNPFLFVRPTPRVEVGINAFNIFNTLAIVSAYANSVPQGGLSSAQVLNGRTVTGSIRYSF